jgi:hypothetical protein
MKITCLHGYFIIREDYSGEVARFNSLYGMDLTAKDDYYTFTPIKEAPTYSIFGKAYLNLLAIKTYEGNPWEVFEQNLFIYDPTLKIIKPISLVTSIVELTRNKSTYSTKGLILPGSISTEGNKITGYQCQFYFDTLEFIYTEFFYASI